MNNDEQDRPTNDADIKEDQHWLGNWLKQYKGRDGRSVTSTFNHTYPAIVIATNYAEAAFLDFFLYMWTAKRKTDGAYVYERRDGWGIYIFPYSFCRRTGMSEYHFHRIVKKYEAKGILTTRIDKRQGNCKYYTLRFSKLRKYLFQCLCSAGEDILVSPPRKDYPKN
jgi:hypothetical protein